MPEFLCCECLCLLVFTGLLFVPLIQNWTRRASDTLHRREDDGRMTECKQILIQLKLRTLADDVVPKINHLCRSKFINIKEAKEVYSILHNLLWILTRLLRKKGDPDLVPTLRLFCIEDRTTECVDTDTLPKQPLVEVIDVIKRLETQMRQCSFIEMLKMYDIVAKALRALHPHT